MKVKASDLPESVLKDLVRQGKLPKNAGTKPSSSSGTVAWRDLPPGWAKCEEHGWAGMGGECLYCPEREEGNSHGESIQNREPKA